MLAWFLPYLFEDCTINLEAGVQILANLGDRSRLSPAGIT
jgi:hypothetical protein